MSFFFSDFHDICGNANQTSIIDVPDFVIQIDTDFTYGTPILLMDLVIVDLNYTMIIDAV
ncbi:19433_t:CDS:2 [Cetraspora pellucida]|uniref:19433_t:CDS:1 n=1 Tax=Cetraspora pellucida TaxID=1433469 RepID=A0A9N9A2P8_9GLOM|nr:19433_t:CDS:2 [Cetraspora pellucida]